MSERKELIARLQAATEPDNVLDIAVEIALKDIIVTEQEARG